jgi:hypothetical protein
VLGLLTGPEAETLIVGSSEAAAGDAAGARVASGGAGAWDWPEAGTEARNPAKTNPTTQIRGRDI